MIRLNLPRSPIAANAMWIGPVLLLGLGILLSGCEALNRMGEEIPQTFQEFGGKGTKEDTSGEGEPVVKEAPPEALLIQIEGTEAEQPEEGDFFAISEPVTKAPTFSFAVRDEETLGEFEYALLKVTPVVDGNPRSREMWRYTERKGRATGIYPGVEIDLAEPNADAIKLVRADSLSLPTYDFAAGGTYQLDLRVIGAKNSATQRVRFEIEP